MSILNENFEPQIDSIGSTCTIIAKFEPWVERMFVEAQEALQHSVNFETDHINDIILQHFPGYTISNHGSIAERGYVKAYISDYDSGYGTVCQIIIHKKTS